MTIKMPIHLTAAYRRKEKEDVKNKSVTLEEVNAQIKTLRDVLIFQGKRIRKLEEGVRPKLCRKCNGGGVIKAETCPACGGMGGIPQ